jgi:hypothetical protein
MDLDYLIEQVASARDAFRETETTAKAANRTHGLARDRLDAARQALREETERRINELSPLQEGDRV